MSRSRRLAVAAVVVGAAVDMDRLIECGSRIGHYRVVKGYDDNNARFITDNPLQRMGPDYVLSWEEFTRLSSGGASIPVYPVEKDRWVQRRMREFRAREILFCPR